MSATLGGDGLIDLYKSDVGAYNELYPKFNANLDWSAKHCVSKPPDAAATAPPK